MTTSTLPFIHSRGFKCCNESPALNHFSDCLECLARKAFCQIVRSLLLCRNFLDFDGAVLDLFPKVVPFDAEVLRPASDLLLCRKEKSSIVILKNLTSDRRREGWRQLDACNDFEEEAS